MFKGYITQENLRECAAFIFNVIIPFSYGLFNPDVRLIQFVSQAK